MLLLPHAQNVRPASAKDPGWPRLAKIAPLEKSLLLVLVSARHAKMDSSATVYPLARPAPQAKRALVVNHVRNVNLDQSLAVPGSQNAHLANLANTLQGIQSASRALLVSTIAKQRIHVSPRPLGIRATRAPPTGRHALLDDSLPQELVRAELVWLAGILKEPRPRVLHVQLANINPLTVPLIAKHVLGGNTPHPGLKTVSRVRLAAPVQKARQSPAPVRQGKRPQQERLCALYVKLDRIKIKPDKAHASNVSLEQSRAVRAVQVAMTAKLANQANRRALRHARSVQLANTPRRPA